jgi:hypothetical protein
MFRPKMATIRCPKFSSCEETAAHAFINIIMIINLLIVTCVCVCVCVGGCLFLCPGCVYGCHTQYLTQH